MALKAAPAARAGQTDCLFWRTDISKGGISSGRHHALQTSFGAFQRKATRNCWGRQQLIRWIHLCD